MRPDQFVRMSELEEKLADVVLEEADPVTWPGSGVPAEDMSRDDRGDRYWCKKNAAATMSLLVRVMNIRSDAALMGGRTRESSEPEVDQDKVIAKAEKEAAKILERFTASRGGN